MLPAIAELYPPNPSNVPPQLSRPTLRYRVQALLVVASLFLFLAVYLSLIAVSAVVTVAAVILMFDLESLKEYGPVGGTIIATLIVLAGLVCGALTLYFLKGLFKFRHQDAQY